MSLQRQLHEEHLARQARMAAAGRAFVRPESPPPAVVRRQQQTPQYVPGFSNYSPVAWRGYEHDSGPRPWRGDVPLPQHVLDPRRHLRCAVTNSDPAPAFPSYQTPIRYIMNAVAAHYRVSIGDMMSARRTENIVRPRQVAMYLCKELTLRSLPDIGRRFGGRDHTTVLHAVRKIKALREIDVELAGDIAIICAELAPIASVAAQIAAINNTMGSRDEA